MINENDVSIEPVTEPVIEPVTDPVLEPVLEPVTEPVLEPVVEQVIDPVLEPVTESVLEPVVEQVIEPDVEQVIEPVTEPVIEPVVEPVTEQYVEPVIELVTEPVVEENKDDFNKLFIISNNKEYDDKISSVSTSDENIKIKTILQNTVKTQLKVNNITFGTSVSSLNNKTNTISINEVPKHARNQVIAKAKFIRRK